MSYIDLNDGTVAVPIPMALYVGGVEVIGADRVLQNVTADAAIITSGTFTTARIPSLAASKITSGVFPVARGGTGLSALGSAGQVLTVNAAGTGLEYAAAAAGVDTAADYTWAGAHVFNRDAKINGATVGRGGAGDSTAPVTSIAIGINALAVATGASNLAFGYYALNKATTGSNNVAFGRNAGVNITTGSRNVALGAHALESNEVSLDNVAIGMSALQNTKGPRNIGIGTSALSASETGTRNVGIGYNALLNATGNDNIAIGDNAQVPDPAGNNQLKIGSYLTGVGGVLVVGAATPGNATAGGVHVIGRSHFAGHLDLTGIPTTNPGGTGRIWRSGNDIKIT